MQGGHTQNATGALRKKEKKIIMIMSAAAAAVERRIVEARVDRGKQPKLT
jgi:hypothetical protein